ncbi:carboxymuconolactone decarboxylase family protein [Rhodococcus koreensis]|uniref:carboxymuconolactone decarboxylase family protein n=1 Tax=Rhodococcus koreensis TaxID=99653 RepID=UPI00366E7CCA
MTSGTDNGYLDGDQLRRDIMGDGWVDRSNSGSTDALAHFSRLAGLHAWNAFWARPGLELRIRSALTIGAMTAMEATDELSTHIQGSLRCGLLNPEEIREVLLHLIPYLGFLRVRQAIVVVNDILAEAEASGSASPEAN